MPVPEADTSVSYRQKHSYESPSVEECIRYGTEFTDEIVRELGYGYKKGMHLYAMVSWPANALGSKLTERL